MGWGCAVITAGLDGVWMPVWQDFALDDAQAVRRGHVTGGGTAAPHGTYARLHLLRVRTADGVAADGTTIENATIEVYDGDAAHCAFRWNEDADRWESISDPIVFQMPAGQIKSGGNDKPFDIPELKLTRYPTLSIAQYSESDAPHPTYKAEYHPVSLGDPSDGSATMPEQTLEYDGDSKTLIWKVQPWSAGKPVMVIRMGTSPLDPQRATPGHNVGQTFGQAFVVQSHLDQVSTSFCGYNPASIGGYSSEGLYSGTKTGTKPQNYTVDNPGQLFNGALLFQFPQATSYDYVQCTYISGSPNVPVGIWPEALDTEVDETHSQFISNSDDEAQAFSVSLGLSGGLDKILSLGGSLEYNAKTKTQKKNESRFTVSRKVAKVWAAHLDPTILSLHETYVAAIRSRTLHLLSDTTKDKSQTVPWDAEFTPSYGTHYANTITHGSIDLAKTWFSLENEITGQEKGFKFAEEASTTLDGLTGSSKSSLSEQWSSKTGLSVSEEDTLRIVVGTPDAVGILVDLRPTTELLSPIFIPYDPDDAWGKFAPWVWTTVRQHYADFLAAKGLNQPIDEDLVVDYTPRRFSVAVTSIYVDGQAPKTALEEPQGNLNGQGTFSISAVPIPGPGDPPSVDGIDPAQSILSLPKPAKFTWHNVHPHPYDAGASATIATSAGNVNAGSSGGLCLRLSYDLTVTEVVREWTYGGAWGQNWTETTVERAHFSATDTRIDLPFADLPHGQLQKPTTTITNQQGIYTLKITVTATDAGGFLTS